MRRRAAGVEETRQRIVEAAMQLHNANGIAATGWDDIARAAGVGVGTVYRHFPTLDELVPACGVRVGEVLALPGDEDIRGLFAGAATPGQRIERLVDVLADLYERGAPSIRTTRREPDVHPVVRAYLDHVDATIAALVDAGLDGLEVGDEDRRVVAGLLDLRTWDALREAGLDGTAARRVLVDLLRRRLAVA
jgi:AcrR family transcriptional regulator